jgi:hypothetical protein
VTRTKYAVRRKRKADSAGEEWKAPVLSCRVCGKRTTYNCVQCSDQSNKDKTVGIFAVCNTSTRHSRDCFANHAATTTMTTTTMTTMTTTTDDDADDDDDDDDNDE